MIISIVFLKVLGESDLDAAFRSAFQLPRCPTYIDNAASLRSITVSFFEFLGQRLTTLCPDKTWKSNWINTIPFGRTAASVATINTQADPARHFSRERYFRYCSDFYIIFVSINIRMFLSVASIRNRSP